jgi:uncharacterized protein YdeI (YjbR/CyaY-like superfamily)
MKPTYFGTPESLRAWLHANSASSAELIVGFYKRHSGTASITWPQAVDEALCVGWVDGVRHRLDERRYKIRFTPRKSSSVWSAINIERVRVLGAEGRMQPAGLEAFARRIEKKSRIYSYEQSGLAALTEQEQKAFKRNRVAWAFFDAQPVGYKKKMLWRIVSAKQATTRERRLAALLEASAQGTRL